MLVRQIDESERLVDGFSATYFEDGYRGRYIIASHVQLKQHLRKEVKKAGNASVHVVARPQIYGLGYIVSLYKFIIYF
jgi:hypothetical protein